MISPCRSPFVPSKGTPPLHVSFTEKLHIQSLLWPLCQSPQLRSFPLQVLLTGPLWREMPVSRASFYISQSPYWTRSPDKNNISPFFQSPPLRSPLPMSPWQGPYGDRPISRAFVYISVREPSERAVRIVTWPLTRRSW